MLLVPAVIVRRLLAGELSEAQAVEALDCGSGELLVEQRTKLSAELRRRADLAENAAPNHHRNKIAQNRIASELRETAKWIDRGMR